MLVTGFQRAAVSKEDEGERCKPDSRETRHGAGEGRERTAFQDSTTGSGARMNLKGEEGGHRDGDKGGKGDQAPT